MSEKFFRIYLYSFIIITFIILVPAILLYFYGNTGLIPTIWGFSMYSFIFVASAGMAIAKTKPHLFENKTHKVAAISVSVFLFALLFSWEVILFMNWSEGFILPFLIEIICAVILCLNLVLLSSYIIQRIKKSVEITPGTVSGFYRYFYIFTSLAGLYCFWRMLDYLSYNYINFQTLLLISGLSSSILIFISLLLGLILLFAKMAWDHKAKVSGIVLVFFGLIIYLAGILFYTVACDEIKYESTFMEFEKKRKKIPPDFSTTSEYIIDETEEEITDDFYESNIDNAIMLANIPPRPFNFISTNPEEEEDSIRVSLENYEPFIFRPAMFEFPDEEFDYTDSNPVKPGRNETDWKSGELTANRVLAFLNKNRDPHTLWGLFQQYKDLIYKCVPYSYYKKVAADIDVQLLLQAYYDLSVDERNFEYVYAIMESKEDNKYKMSFFQNYIHISKESYELNTELNTSYTSNYILIYSFWGRRWKEGNLDVCYAILSDIYDHYNKAGQ